MSAAATIEELAADLCENDATMADAALDDCSAYPGWAKSSDERKAHFRAKAAEEVASGRFILGQGWAEED